MPIPPSQMTAETTLGGQTPRATHLPSKGIKREWDERIKAHSVFSARTTSERYVEMLKKRLAEVASRQMTPQKAEELLRRSLQDLGYKPETGFADARGAVPAVKPGDIRDLSSSRRILLIIDTNVKQARSLGQIAASEDPMMLMMEPAWKLTRTGARKKPRGDWKKRWVAAGAKCGWKGAVRKQMVALKTSPIWQALADGAGGFEDTLGSPYPPFAFGSGLAWVNVGRGEWKKMCAAEGVPDGLEDVTAKAKELKKKGGMGIGEWGMANPDYPDYPESPGGAARLQRQLTPQTAPIAAFKADFKARLAADDAIDEALDAARRELKEADAVVEEMAKLREEAGKLGGETSKIASPETMRRMNTAVGLKVLERVKDHLAQMSVKRHRTAASCSAS